MALQLRRGTNAQRLGMTPANGELIFVTDYALVSTSVTSINTTTDTLSTTAAHGLSVNQQVKYIGDTLNGLTADQVYFVKTAPTITDFTLSTTSGGGTLNITGSFTVDLVFAKTPTTAAGAPVGTGVSPLWIGDGSTVGGIIGQSINLDDLLDVVITDPVNEGQFLWYDGTNWINTNEPTVGTTARALNLIRRSTTAVQDFETTPALILTSRVTDAINDNTDDAGPAVRYQRSSGTQSTKTYVSGGAIGAFTVTLNNVTGLVVGNKVTGTGLPDGNGALITVIAGNQLTLDTAFTVQAAGTYTIGAPVAFGQISMEYFGTTDVHKFRVTTTTDNFLENPVDQYPGTYELIDSSKNATNINQGILYIDGVNNRVGVNNTSPTVALDVTGAGRFSGKITTTDTTQSSSQSTGSIITSGGVGIAKNLHVGGTVSVDNGNNATSTTTGSIQTDGGIGVVSDIFVGGQATITGDVAVNGGDLTTTAATGNLFNTTATTVNIGGAATTMSVGNASGTVTIPGNLTVNGTTTTINSQTLLVKDKNIEMGVVTTPTDVTADGGGIILKGTTDKTILYDNALGAWVSNINFNTTGSTLGNITVGVVDDNTISTTTGDLAITATGSNVVDITSGNNGPTTITRNSSGTNTAIRTLTISAQSTGTPAAGFGNSLEYEIETAVGNTERAGFVSVISTDVTPTSEDFSMNFGLMTAGATAATKMSLNNAGDLEIDGDLTVTGGDITTAAATAAVFNTTATTLNIGGAATQVTIGVSGAGAVDIATTTDSSSQSTGALQVAGGVGIIKNLHVGGTISVDNGNNATSTTTGSIQTDGGIGVVADIFVGGKATITGDIVVNGNTTLGSNSSDTVAVNGLVTGNIAFTDNSTTTVRGTYGTVGTNDYWHIGGGAAGSNAGYAVIATGDDGTEPIYVQQYTSGTATTTLTLLDGSNNTLIPNNLSTNGDLFVENNKSVYISGPNLVLNNGDTAGGNVDITSYRGVAGATSARIRWNETSDRWQTTVDNSIFLNIPNQELDTTDDVSFSSVVVDGAATINTQTTTTTALTAVSISSTTRASQKAIIRIIDNVTGEIQMLEALAFSKSTTAYLTTYAEMYSNAALATFTADVSAGSIRILATPLSTNSTTFTVVRTSLD
jgi:hypothetical protein